ncbi:saccharopine dehydrogenase NADP-binding domain-containing protein [Actinoplanes couchii]|uniref:Saccharopine dehydrogenase NADP binding domain-containing protein n=1 Tax=Actinoplanes couchii TaxID=403638 RepID=A0ABQ3XE06_9ACTN|nr:saccharopine dehydrogenase NADP-binding domain-containing protein [Actinoplanes couchii]MDR6317247.1 hypothetical protein [Actinoplanes couchii]GID56740.1 hypothetical protein Aco03nite_051440 [Actinoplanes couchii]
MTTKTLILGGYGAVGREAAAALAPHTTVVVAGRNPSKAPEGVEALRVDLTDFAQVEAALDGVDAVLMCAEIDNARVARAALERGINYADVSATPSVLAAIASLRPGTRTETNAKTESASGERRGRAFADSREGGPGEIVAGLGEGGLGEVVAGSREGNRVEREGNRVGHEGGRAEREGGRVGHEENRVGHEGGRVGREGNRVGHEGGQVGREGNRVGHEGGQVGREGGQVGVVAGTRGGEGASDSAVGGAASGWDRAGGSGATAVLSVGIAPGVTNLLARYVSERAPGQPVRIGVLLGSGEKHGAAAVGWTVDGLGQERGSWVAEFPVPYGRRTVHRFPFSDQHTLNLADVRTGLALDSRASTVLLGLANRPGLASFLRRPGLRAFTEKVFGGLHLGSDGFAVMAEAGGVRASFAGNRQSLATGLFAAHVIRRVCGMRAGVAHIEDLVDPAEFLTALAADGFRLEI